MLKSLKISAPESDIWFCSDMHMAHNRVWIYDARGFKTIEEHDNTIIHRWNEVCSSRSIVFNLGDFVFNDSDGERFKSLCRRLSFNTMYLLAGNHISGHLAIYKGILSARFPDSVRDDHIEYEVYPLEYLVDGNPNKRVVFLSSYAEANVNGVHCVLCHYPIVSHNKLGKGSFHLSGHSHHRCALTNKDTGQGYRLDVGIDAFGRPINIREIKALFAGRTLASFDHHGKHDENNAE